MEFLRIFLSPRTDYDYGVYHVKLNGSIDYGSVIYVDYSYGIFKSKLIIIILGGIES